eukprot:GEZU01008319.1.p2 GENE.GEZU01008319.1~~GEZU01008319.1.p2  ORF type:complete len:122 (-),score=20.38 GEZU01008319.1:94-459(-)
MIRYRLLRAFSDRPRWMGSNNNLQGDWVSLCCMLHAFFFVSCFLLVASLVAFLLFLHSHAALVHVLMLFVVHVHVPHTAPHTALKTKKAFYVSFNLPRNSPDLQSQVERVLVAKLKDLNIM